MAEPLTTHRAYVLLHRSTGTALYTTCATEAEIHQANRNLKRAGHPARYVEARHRGTTSRAGHTLRVEPEGHVNLKASTASSSFSLSSDQQPAAQPSDLHGLLQPAPGH